MPISLLSSSASPAHHDLESLVKISLVLLCPPLRRAGLPGTWTRPPGPLQGLGRRGSTWRPPIGIVFDNHPTRPRARSRSFVHSSAQDPSSLGTCALHQDHEGHPD